MNEIPDALTSPAVPLVVRDLGRMAYAPALALQRETHARVALGECGPVLFLVEHDPVITISNRKLAGQNLVADPDTLNRLGIEVQSTDRGGDITYHGPGQLVAYPILRLGDHRLNLGRHMRLLEETVIRTLECFGVTGRREAGAAGVWVDRMDPSLDSTFAPAAAKVCAVGVRIARNTTLHGLALNVTTRLDHFNTIVPCGLVGRPVTSLEQILGDRCPSMAEVKRCLTQSIFQALEQAFLPSSPS